MPYYCEENVWKYLSKLPVAARARAWAVFIFGAHGNVAVCRQKTGTPQNGFVLWDYHVIALQEKIPGRIDALDFDSTLGFCTEAHRYLEAAFPPGLRIEAAANYVSPLFRLILAEDFVTRFYSDRSHMKATDGTWLQPPPEWDFPSGAAGQEAGHDAMKLADLLNPEAAGIGQVLGLEEMAEFVKNNSPSSK